MTIYKFPDFQNCKFDFLLLCNKWKHDNHEKKNDSKGYQLAGF
jgi:hypothetical protein